MQLGLGLHLGSRSAGGSAHIATSLQPIEKGNTQLGVATSAAGTAAQYTVHTVKGGGTGMVLTFAAAEWSSPNKGELGLGNDLTVRAAIEYPLGSGTFTNVLFSGAVTGTVTNASYLDSDAFSHTWADGDEFGLWVHAAGAKVPIRNTASNNGVELYTDEGCITGAAVSTTPSNAIVDNGNRSTRLCACVGIFAQRPVTDTTIAVMGDSLQAGTNSGAPTNFATSDRLHGDMTRSFGQYYACVNIGIGADTMTAALYSVRTIWRLLQSRATCVVNAYGTNDFGIRGFAPAELLAHRQRFLPLFKNRKYIDATLTPRATSSSDNYVTEASQVTPSYSTDIDTFNTTIRAQSHFLERRTPVQGVTASKWIVDGTAFYATVDGTHMSLAGQNLIVAQAAAFKTAFDAAAVSTATQPSTDLSGSLTFSGGKLTAGTGTIAGTACVAFGATMEFFATVGASVITDAFDIRAGAAGRIRVNSSGQLVYCQSTSGTTFTGTTDISSTGERHISVVEKQDGTGANVYLDGVLEIAASFTPTGTNTISSTSIKATSGTGNAVREVGIWKGELRTGAFTPPSPGWISTPASEANLIAYWPLATNGTGQLGGYLPQ